jgi:hypothetical protein
MALDRGNSVGFAVPLLVWFFQSLKNQRQSHSIFAIALLTVIKPHFVLMAILFLIRGRLKSTAITIGLTGLIHIISFLLIDQQAFPANVTNWFTRFFSYQEYSSITLQWPQNISFTQGLYSLFFAFSRVLNINLEPALTLLDANQSSIGLLVFVLTVLGLAITKSHISDQHLGIIVVSLVAMTSATSFYYYGIFAAPALLALMSGNGGSRARQVDADTNHRVNFILWCALIGTHVQLPIYRVWLVPEMLSYWADATNDVVVTSATFVGVTWMLAYSAIFFVIVWTKLSKIATK